MPTHLSEDIATVFARDPAARSRAEVLLCYPGVKAPHRPQAIPAQAHAAGALDIGAHPPQDGH